MAASGCATNGAQSMCHSQNMPAHNGRKTILIQQATASPFHRTRNRMFQLDKGPTCHKVTCKKSTTQLCRATPCSRPTLAANCNVKLVGAAI
eukprot:1525920-Amphidinium_carterae.1